MLLYVYPVGTDYDFSNGTVPNNLKPSGKPLIFESRSHFSHDYIRWHNICNASNYRIRILKWFSRCRIRSFHLFDPFQLTIKQCIGTRLLLLCIASSDCMESIHSSRLDYSVWRCRWFDWIFTILLVCSFYDIGQIAKEMGKRRQIGGKDVRKY